MEIRLNGVKDSLNFILPDGYDKIGGKGIGVFGGLDMHGRPRNVTWTHLSQTALAGSSNITLVEPVDWTVGEEIAISTTTFIVNHTETFRIAAVSPDHRTLTLNTSLVYTHLVASESFDGGQSYHIAAAVGLLSRNIKIIGTEYAIQSTDLYGFRIIVSDYSYQTTVNNISLYNYYRGYARISNVEFVHGGQFSL